jgi:two-component system, NtrC family, response regulator HydG
MKKLLIIDDEPEMLQSLRKILGQRSDLEIVLMQDAAEALTHVSDKKYDMILTDLNMGEVSGIDILRAALGKYPDTKVCVISGYGTIEASVEAMHEGATDFLEKPFTSKKLFSCIDNVFESLPDEESHEIPVSEEAASESNLIYKSSQMKNVVSTAKKVAGSDVNVLITGESGTGKELIARAIHNLSKRMTNPFVPVNCGALPENLFESEIFGHEKGAFTGAVRTKPGLLEFANKGTFFFDEIGDLSLTLQVKLLRMLEERKIRRVGGQKEIEIDVRIIAATNQELSQAVTEKKFREDLYYRLNTIQVEIPPLRERNDDILPLANHFLTLLSTKNDKVVNGFSSDAEDSLIQYAWPGNVRELQNMISRAFYLCSGRVIQKGDLPISVSGQTISIDEKMFDLSYKDAKDYVLEKFEVEYLTHHLRQFNGNISKTAEHCGIDRRSIHRLINKYNLIIH